MKNRMVRLMIGATMTGMVAGATIPAIASEDMLIETTVEEMPVEGQETETVETVAEVETETVTEVQTEIETEIEDDFIEGSALLSDYDYKAGTMDENEWVSEFLNMKFVPGDDIKMDAESNKQLEEYYTRHGEDKIVATGEMVAKDENGGYIQLTVEVNPNSEVNDDILERFTELENLELVSKTRDTEIAEKTFRTCTGIYEKEKYMLGVCTDVDNLVLAFKMKYKDTASRKAMLACFDTVIKEEDETEEVSEEATEAVSEETTEENSVSDRTREILTLDNVRPNTKSGLDTPEEFEDAQLITEEASEE